MLRFALVLVAAVAGALPAVSAAEDGEPPIALSDWKIERFRYDENKVPKAVKAEIKITNTGKAALADVKSRLIYYTATGEMVRETQWQFATTILAGEGRLFKYHEGLVPAFEAYELELTCKIEGQEQKWTWRSPDPAEPPQLKITKPLPGVSHLVILGRESNRDGRTGLTRVFCRVKNQGERPAQRTALTVEFLNDKGQVLATHEQPIGEGGTVPGGKELVLNFTVPKPVPPYYGMRVKLSALKVSDEEALSGGKFSDRPEVEVAEVSLKRPKPAELAVTAKIRNGRKEPVNSPTVVWVFTDKGKEVKRAPLEVPGKLAPGEIKAISQTIPDCPAFSAYSYEIEFQERTETTFQPVSAQVAEGKAGVEKVEVARDKDGTLHFTAQVRSRAPHEVTAFNVTFKLLGGPKSEVVGQCAGGLDKLAAGATATVTAELIKPPQFVNYTFHVTYSEPTPPPAKKPPEPAEPAEPAEAK